MHVYATVLHVFVKLMLRCLLPGNNMMLAQPIVLAAALLADGARAWLLAEVERHGAGVVLRSMRSLAVTLAVAEAAFLAQLYR